jgi:hypothetical protein
MIRLFFKIAGVPALFLFGTISVSAAECDFENPIGECKADLKIVSASGSKPSFSAEILVKSSVKSCSKVEWFLDNTPQTTILKSQSSEAESVFGTSAIEKKSISVQKCTAYAEKGASESVKAAARYGSCAGSAEARALLDQYDPAPEATLASSLSNMRANLPQLKTIVARTRGYRDSRPEFYAENKAQIERDIAGLQKRVDWNSNAIRVLGACAK